MGQEWIAWDPWGTRYINDVQMQMHGLSLFEDMLSHFSTVSFLVTKTR